MQKIKRGISAGAVALALCLGGCAAVEPAPAQVPAAVTAQLPTVTLAPASDVPVKLAAEPECSNVKLLDVDLDAETQRSIYWECGSDPELFCFVMAIAHQESRFQPDAVGDGGRCIGMLQINARWHTERMENLGVTDLTDPVQCAAVAVDYLRELEGIYGFAPLSHELLMGYNLGPGGARRTLKRGTTSTAYSREVMATYQNYLKELKAEDADRK